MEIKCTYRTWLNYLNLAVCAPIYVVMFVGLVNMKAPVYMFVAYIYIAIYNVLRIYNKKVIFCDDVLITYGAFGKRREYKLCDITKIVVENMSYRKNIVIHFDKVFVRVRKDISNYDDLVKALCDKLNIKGYTRGGVSEFNIK